MKMNRMKSLCLGITLIEVLVTVVVLAFGMLGLAGLQATSLRNNHSAFLRTQATYMAYDIFDRMRANRVEAVDNGFYNVTLADTAANTSGTTLTEYDVNNWLAALGSSLPEGDGSINCDTATNVCTVIVQWNDTRAAGDIQQFDMSAEL